MDELVMALHPWKKIRQSLEIKNPWWTYRKDDVLLPSGKEGEYHFVHVLGSSLIVPVLDDGRVILVNQYRYLARRESIEFPCGSVKEGSSYDETAAHELAEETGYHADTMECVGEFNPYNGVTDEICQIYLAKKLLPTFVAHDDTEEFERLILSPYELAQRISAGKIWDGMTLAAWAIVKDRLR